MLRNALNSMKKTIFLSFCTRLALALGLACIARVATAQTSTPPVLTGIMVFSCDGSGNPAGNFAWDTRNAESDFYKIFLTRGVPSGTPDGLSGAFINGPN